MKKHDLIQQLIANFQKTLNKSSKWYKQDIEDFKLNISKLSVSELTERLGRSNAVHNENSTFNKTVKSEINKMDKDGLFNPDKLKNRNGLD